MVVARQQPHVSCVFILKTTPALASPSPCLPLPPLLLGGCTPVSAGKSALSVGWCVCLLCAFVLLSLSGWIPRSSLCRAQSSILVGAIHGLCLLCYASDDHDVLVPPEYLIYIQQLPLRAWYPRGLEITDVDHCCWLSFLAETKYLDMSSPGMLVGFFDGLATNTRSSCSPADCCAHQPHRATAIMEHSDAPRFVLGSLIPHHVFAVLIRKAPGPPSLCSIS